MVKQPKPDHATVLSVPYRQIFIPNSQIRSDEPEITAIAEDLKDKGQLYPVLVVNGGPGDKPYTLVEGFRRMAAWKINDWQDSREVLVRVVAGADPVTRIVTNWAANMQREGFSPLDQAECINNLNAGTYAVLEGEESIPVERSAIAQRLGMSIAQVSRLIRLHRNLDADVASQARQVGAPLHILLEIAEIKGEGEEAEEQLEDRCKKQTKVLAEWIKKQEKLSAEGRKRSERSDKGKKRKKGGEGDGDGEGAAGVISPKKKVKHATYADGARSYAVSDYLRVLSVKQDALAVSKSKADKDQAVRLKGMVDVIRFLVGEISRLPDLTKVDFEVLHPAEETEGEEESDEGGE